MEAYILQLLAEAYVWRYGVSNTNIPLKSDQLSTLRRGCWPSVGNGHCRGLTPVKDSKRLRLLLAYF